MYKGYLKGNGKHAATSFKDGSKLLSYNTVRLVDSYVGILEDDFIMVDVDDIEEAEILLDIVEDKNINCSVLQTNNGMHFYFKGYDLTANKIKWYSNIGLCCDYKLGIKNTADPLKIKCVTFCYICYAQKVSIFKASWHFDIQNVTHLPPFFFYKIKNNLYDI